MNLISVRQMLVSLRPVGFAVAILFIFGLPYYITRAGALTNVNIDGPTIASAQVPHTFVAIVNPVTATTPITYMWDATGQTSVIHANTFAITDAITFAWNTAGTQVVTVTVTNEEGTATDVHSIIVNYQVYLPIVVKRWPPIPYAPTIGPIDNSDGDDNYFVYWAEQPSSLADDYTLQEATNAAFTVNLRDVCTTTPAAQDCYISGKLAGTYYYRVRGHNFWGYGDWSNVLTALVLLPSTPTMNAIDNGDGDGSLTMSDSR